MAASELHLNRAFTNNAFSSWRLGHDPAATLAETVPLCGGVRRKQEQSFDYLHTRLSLLANRLYQLGKDLYTFLEDALGLTLYKYSSPSGLQQVVALGTPEEVTSPGVDTAPTLESSLAAVQVPEHHEQSTGEPKLFLASSGQGDLVLIIESETPTVVHVNLVAATPALQPFIVEAAYHVLPGIMRAVLWTIKDKTSQHPASCMLYLATICYDLHAREAHMQASHPLGQSKLPPHAVVVSAKDDAVAVAIDPADPHAPASSNVGLGASEGAAVDMDDDMPSPRTLRAAAERLAQYTSEAQEPASGAVSNVFSDLYSEASPADEASNLETESVVYLYTCNSAASIEPATPKKDDVKTEAQAAAAAAQPSPQQDAVRAQPRLVKEVSCSPYKLLTSQASGIDRKDALLGLIDDVDTAIVSLSWNSAGSIRCALEHVSSIPAFSYVATGKPQRKFVLLGRPGQKVAAVIVEANKFAFIYHAVQPDAPNGIHQVLDLGLAKNESVIGAALQADLHRDSMTRLVIMTEQSLRVYDLH